MDDILTGKTVLSVISTEDFKVDHTEHHRQIISSLSQATGLPWNYLCNEIGDILDFCLQRNYTDRLIMASCFARIFANHCVDISDDLEEV